MKKCILFFLTVAFLLMISAGCSQKTSKNIAAEEADGKISIVATIFPPYDFARAIAKDRAYLTMLLKPGSEIHSYDPTPADIIKIENADVFIYIGGESDEWVDTILSSMDTSKMKIVRLMDCVEMVEEEAVEGMEHEHEHEHEHEQDPEHDQDHEKSNEHESEEVEYDEHIWTSPQNAVLMVNAIADALCEADEANVGGYRQNADDYTEKILEADKEIQEIVDSAPRKMIVFGDRFPFRYLADEFGLTYRAAFAGCSTETEASAGTMAYLMNTIRENKIPYIYYIELSSKNIAKAISEQTGAGMLLLHSCQNISKDDFDKGVTYVDLMKQNAESLRKGLN